jgi:Fic family protein
LEYEQIAGVKSATAKRQIADLMQKRILVKKGGGTVFWYEIAKDNT